MGEITKKAMVYKYEELSTQAKEVAKNGELTFRQECGDEIFTEICEEQLKNLFPNSDLEIQYELGYSQGDGFNIYGTLNIKDAFNFVLRENKNKLQLTENSINELESYIEELSDIELEENNKYSYCYVLQSMEFIEEIWVDEIEMWYEYEGIEKEIHENVLIMFKKLLQSDLESLCYEFEKKGYSYFYEISEYEMKELSASNEYEYLENGNLFSE